MLYRKYKIKWFLIFIFTTIIFVNLMDFDSNGFANWRNFESKVDTWQDIGDPKLRYKVFSAYFDDRRAAFGKAKVYKGSNIKSIIRVITILPLHVSAKDLFCHFKYENGDIKIFHPSDVYPHPHRARTKFLVTLLACPITNVYKPQYVGITYKTEENLNNLVQIRYPQNYTRYNNPEDSLAVCPLPIHYNYKWALRMVEFIEIHKMLGATKFYIYNDTSTADVGKVIQYYEKQGTVQYFNWKIEKEYEQEVELRITAHFASFNDCLYRAHVVDNVKYLAIVDYDEILMTFDGSKTLLDFVEEHDSTKLHSFSFRNVFFFNTFTRDYSPIPSSAVNKYLVSQIQIERTAESQIHKVRSKYIAKVKDSIFLGNHFVLKGVRKTKLYRAQPEVALSFHYRECFKDYCDDTNRTIDLSARKFGPKLWDKVDAVCAAVFKDKICPN